MSHNSGHRSRLRNRFMNAGINAFSDHELLEILLCSTNLRKDTKTIAKNLLKEFGSLAQVLGSDIVKLQKIAGIGEASAILIKSTQEIMRRILITQLEKKDILSNIHKVIEYCNLCMAYADIEHFRIIFLNKKNMILCDELQQKGTIDHAIIYPREILKRAIELNAGALIMVHNHPAGDPNPSKPDIYITQQVKKIIETVNIKLHDHIIIGKYGYISMREEGYFSA